MWFLLSSIILKLKYLLRPHELNSNIPTSIYYTIGGHTLSHVKLELQSYHREGVPVVLTLLSYHILSYLNRVKKERVGQWV